MNEDYRVALIGIIVNDRAAVEQLNSLLHEHAQYIIGRMGIPYPKRGVSVISVAVDAPNDVINSLAGKLGMIDGISSKTTFPKA